MNKPKHTKNPAAMALGKKGGLKRAANLSKAQRSKIAKAAAKARWNNPTPTK